MFWDDCGNKVLAATWRRLSFHSHFQFLLTTLKGITVQTEEEEEQQAGAGEGLGYEATSDKAAQEGRAQKKQDFQPDFWRKSCFVPHACHTFQHPFSASLFRGKREAARLGGRVLACHRFCDSPNPSIGESSNEDDKARASSFENLPNKSVTRGTGIEAPRSCPEV